jgi:hypothetical protein
MNNGYSACLKAGGRRGHLARDDEQAAAPAHPGSRVFALPATSRRERALSCQARLTRLRYSGDRRTRHFQETKNQATLS